MVYTQVHMKPNLVLHSCKIYRLNARFQNLRCQGQKLTILQALKVGPFCPEKWSEDWTKFVAKFLGCDVIWGTVVLFTLADFMSRRRIFRRKPCPVFRKWVIHVWIIEQPRRRGYCREGKSRSWSNLRSNYQEEPLAEVEDDKGNREADVEGLTPAVLETIRGNIP